MAQNRVLKGCEECHSLGRILRVGYKEAEPSIIRAGVRIDFIKYCSPKDLISIRI